MQGRGLKPKVPLRIIFPLYVAPYAGAWIETGSSEPTISLYMVAPYAGAWIETYSPISCIDNHIVAPYAGAWIETLGVGFMGRAIRSPLMQGRGLKHFSHPPYFRFTCRPLCRGVD